MIKRSTRVCFIFNPAADRSRSTRHIEWLKEEAARRWHHFEIDITRKNQNVTDLAQSKTRHFDLIVACGGDGTVNHVVNGIAGSNAVFGVLPVGSGNDFVKTMGLDKTLPECLDLLHREKITTIDLIRIDGDAKGWCANTIGVGLDGLANVYASQYRKLKGHIVYVLGALKAAVRFRGAKFNYVMDGDEFENNFLMLTACNGKWEGGSFYVAPEADMYDGKINILTIERISLVRVLSYLPRFRWGPSPGMKGVTSGKCTSLELWTDRPVAVHNDGEHLGSNIRHLKLTVQPEALQVISP